MGSNVDTSIHPHTTGRAAALSDAHSSPHPLKLYAGWFCPFVQRAWIPARTVADISISDTSISRCSQQALSDMGR